MVQNPKHTAMKLSFTEQEQSLLRLIALEAQKLGYPAYLIGGFVRDRLLHLPTKDLDIMCVGSGIALAQAVQKALKIKTRLVTYRRFGTALIKTKDLEIEFVGARKESYRKDSRKPSVENGSLQDDLNRRDFTINALAVELQKDKFGTLIDPFQGLKDLENRCIRTPLDPDKTFSDDPLRMMRAIRFACQLEFNIEQKTLQSIAKYKDRIKIVSQERITTEIQKIMSSLQPSVGWELLFETGLLKHILPELQALYGVETKFGISHKDNFYHTMEVLDNLSYRSDNIWLRWAALLHDIAKPPTKAFHPKSGWTFHGHEVVGAKMVPKIFKKLKLPLDTKMKYVQKLVRLHLRPISLTKENITDSAIRRLLFDAADDIDDLMLLCKADITSKDPARVKRYLKNFELVSKKIKEVEENDRLKNWQPPITGEIIMKTFDIPPSKNVGIIKDAIREAILDGLIPNNYDHAYEFMLQEADKLGLTPRT